MDDRLQQQLTAVLAYGVQVIRPEITRFNSASSRGGSYLQVTRNGQSFSIPIQDFSVSRTAINRFR